MPPKRRRVNTSTLPSTPQPVNPAAVEERARAAAVSAAALAEVNAGFDESDESDGDVDADELRVLPVRPHSTSEERQFFLTPFCWFKL